jgi:ABC-type multidrug transport system permease subunit
MGRMTFVRSALTLWTMSDAYDTQIRESSSRMYTEIVFALGQLIAETPYSILCAVAFFLLWVRGALQT